MTDNLTLAERVEAASGPDRELDRLIQLAVRKSVPSDRWTHRDEIPPQKPKHFTASLDAAMTLVPEGWLYTGSATHSEGHKWGLSDWNSARVEAGIAATPALALCAASLRARSHGSGGQG